MADVAEIQDTEADTKAFAAVRAICRRHAKDFYYASVFLPRFKRDAAYAVHAFVRLINEAMRQPEVGDGRDAEQSAPPPPTTVGASTCCSGNSLDQRLDVLRAMLGDIYAGRVELPLPDFRTEGQHALHAYAITVRRYEIPQEHFLTIAEGCRMDLMTRRYATWKSLEAHCYHTAGVVGLIMACVFGAQHSDVGARAVQMGNAMRLTSILRNIKPDFDRGRVYLPLEDMVRFGYSERDLARSVLNDNFRELMKFEIDRARTMYREAAEGVCWLAGDGSRVSAATMALVQSGILRAIERQQYDVLTNNATQPTTGKLRRLPAAWRLACREANDPVPDVF